MQHQLYYKKTAFSLVEMLISLIIFSVIIGVFVPIISQKLLSSSIAINGFLTENGIIKDNVSIRPELDSQEACDLLGPNLLFLTAEQNGGKRACVTKANVGDTYADGPKINPTAGVTVVNAGESCGSSSDYSSKCCWLGNNVGETSSSCSASGNGDSTYSGCKRTVCNWNAAKSACANWEPDNSATLGKWRLPSKNELSAWSSHLNEIQKNKGKNGLELCDNSSGYGSVQCLYQYYACSGAMDSNSYPSNIWSSDEYDSSYAYVYSLGSGSSSTSGHDYKTDGLSARCLIDEDGYKEAYNNRVNKDDNSSTEPPSSDPSLIKSQADCDKLGPNLLFLTAEQNGGKRACVTKANVGDSYANGPDLDKIKSSAGITVVNANSSCGSSSDYSSKCCWLGNNVGTTASGCGASGNGDSTYSGCKRTVCTWAAAKAACTAYEPDGSGTKGKWRLPTQSELSAWGSNLSTIQKNQGKNGLELCDWFSSYGSVGCDVHDSACPGAMDSDCHPYIVWSSVESSSSHAYGHLLGSGSFRSNDGHTTYAFSARCIIDEDDIKGSGTVTPSEPVTPTLPDDITSQEDCDKLGDGLLFIEASNKKGSLCVTKANVGDVYENGPDLNKIKNNVDITVVNAGSSCGTENNATKCCWLGNGEYITSDSCTDDGNMDSTYSGCKRTVCNWYAAKAACENWEPDGSNTKGKWRLPTNDELEYWGYNLEKLNTYKGKGGLQLCEYYKYNGSVTCDNSYNCSGECDPRSIWSNEDYYGGSNAYYCSLMSKKFNLQYSQKTTALSVRCVLDRDSYTRKGSKPTSLTSQEDCNYFGDNLLFLTSKQNGGKAACVTKANVGDIDAGGPNFGDITGSFATVTTANNTCDSSIGCCWKGSKDYPTSENCGKNGNGDSTYSGCYRTVCDNYAARSLCSGWEPVYRTRGLWRLPTAVELQAWNSVFNKIQKNKGLNGLQLCDWSSSSHGSVACSPNYNQCNVSGTSGGCYPDHVWSSDSAGSDSGYYGTLSSGIFKVDDFYYYFGMSVRCLIDEDAVKSL